MEEQNFKTKFISGENNENHKKEETSSSNAWIKTK
jgi:hypothetical protein